MKMPFSNRKLEINTKFDFFGNICYNNYVNFYKEVIQMTSSIVFNQLSKFVKLVGADRLINAPTPEELEAFEGLLFDRGIPNISFIMQLSEAQ